MEHYPEDEADALGPLTAAFTFIGFGMAVLLAVVGFAAVFGSGSIFGWGDPTVCVDATNGDVPIIDTGSTPILGLRPATSSFIHSAGMCLTRPSGGAHVLEMLTSLPGTLLLIGFLLLFWRLLRRARRHGLFELGVVRQLRFLGWFLIVGLFLTATIQAVASSTLISRMLTGKPWYDFPTQWHLSFSLLLAGLGILAFARLAKLGGGLRSELELMV